MLTCKDATRMMASEEFAEAGWWERLRVRVHLAMCRHCRRYAAQMRAIGACAREHWGPQTEDSATLQRLEDSILKRHPETPQDSS